MKKLFLLAALAAGAFGAGSTLAKPFTPEELSSHYRTLYYGINKIYQDEPPASRPEGCVVFEIRILRDGTASTFKKVEGEFANPALLKKIQHFVLGRFSAPRDHLEEPQTAAFPLCFNGDKGVSGKPEDAITPPAPIPQAADMMDNERNGISNREWLEKMMLEEGTAAPPSAAPIAAPRGQLSLPQ